VRAHDNLREGTIANPEAAGIGPEVSQPRGRSATRSGRPRVTAHAGNRHQQGERHDRRGGVAAQQPVPGREAPARRRPPAELDPAGLLPESIYSKEELQTYLEYGREKCRATLEGLTEEQAQRPCKFPWGEVSYLELQLYNMRHIQEHASQLNLFLGQKIGSAPGWITGARRRQSGE